MKNSSRVSLVLSYHPQRPASVSLKVRISVRKGTKRAIKKLDERRKKSDRGEESDIRQHATAVRCDSAEGGVMMRQRASL